jgi:hypothetical protein
MDAAATPAFCLLPAVHAGLSVRTNMIVSFWNHHFSHVPIAVAVSARKQEDRSAGARPVRGTAELEINCA